MVDVLLQSLRLKSFGTLILQWTQMIWKYVRFEKGNNTIENSQVVTLFRMPERKVQRFCAEVPNHWFILHEPMLECDVCLSKIFLS